MRSQIAIVAVVVALSVVAAGQLAGAQQGQDAQKGSSTHRGEFVKAEDGQFSMTIRGEKQHSHKVTSDTEVMIDGKPAKLEDLKEGDRITVTMGKNNVALRVEATRQERERQADEKRPQKKEAPSQAVLGVRFMDSPGAGVLVTYVVPDGPAAKAGIQPGDYILSLNGEKSDRPDEFMKALEGMQPGDEMTLMTWRNGRETKRQAQLVARDEVRYRPERTYPTSERKAWLGVLLAESAEGGASVRRVYPGGPAAQGGLQAGDVILSINESKVESAREAADVIAKSEPNSEAEIVVQREGEKQTISVTLGSNIGTRR